MMMGDVMMREQELAEEFKAGLSPDRAVALQLRVEELETQAADLQKQNEALQNDATLALVARDKADARADKAEGRAEKAERAATRAKASVKTAETAAAPRKLKKMDDGLHGDELVEALQKADLDGKTVEIAFLDGEAEIPGIPPKTIVGDVFKEHSLGRMLRDPVSIDGPGDTTVSIDGYALLIDGKQVAYCGRSEPVRVGPGQKVSLADDIWF